jgi:molybdopterin molybdotransferase
VRAPLAEASWRVLRETVCAPEDLPPLDRSTRDGYAIRADDASKTFSSSGHASRRRLETAPIQTRRSRARCDRRALPCDGLRVVMQENVERNGDQIRIVRRENSSNIRLRGEDVRQGQPLVQAGTKLNAGALAILATAGHVNPLVSPRLRVLHFTTGDEIVSARPNAEAGPDSRQQFRFDPRPAPNFPCDVEQAHLPEDFERAKSKIEDWKSRIENADLMLVSGGASVGEKDFTRPLLEWLGFEIVFSRSICVPAGH